MNDHDSGIYVLQVYSGVAGQDSSSVLQSYISKYGDDAVTELGALSNGTNIQSVAKAVAKSSLSSPTPAKVDFTQAFLDAGGSVSFTKAAIAGVEEAGSEIASTSLSILKWGGILVGIVVVGYIAWELGWVKSAASKVRTN